MAQQVTRSRVIVDVSNLSIHAKKFIRTGIQEVVYQTLLALVQVREEFPDLELILLPQLPRRFGNLLQQNTTVPYQNPATFILEGIEEQLRLPSKSVWGFDLKNKNYQLTDEEAFQWIASAQKIHIQGMVNVGPLMESLNAAQSQAFNNLSMSIYDLVPVLFPEYCDHGLARWFQQTYLPAIGKYVKNAVCISKSTAMDVLSHPLTQAIPQVTVLPLPFELNQQPTQESGILKLLSLEIAQYLVYLGSLEPRKYFQSILSGFETYRNLCPESKLKLVMVGGTGWKNFQLEKSLKNSPCRMDIVRVGYLQDAELEELLRRSTALIMVSQYEGYGLPVAQAFSMGKPVITTLGSSLPEACRGRGIFVEPHDSYSVCAGIQQALEVQFKMGDSNQLDAINDNLGPIKTWTWQKYSRELLGLICSNRIHLNQ